MPTVGRTLMLGAGGQGGDEPFVLSPFGYPVVWPEGVWRSESHIDANAAGEGRGHVIRSPVAGSLQRFQVRTGTVTVAGNLTARVETVDPATGLNTGSLVAAGAEVASQAAVANSWNEFVLATPPTLAKGDIVALMVQTLSTTTLHMTSTSSSTTPWNGLFPYGLTNTAGTWGKINNRPMVRVMIDGAWVAVPGTWPHTTTSTQVIGVSPAGNPDEVGNLITMPATVRCAGMRFVTQGASGDDYRARLYASDDTVLREVVQDGDVISTNGTGFVNFPFTPLTLIGGDSYRLTVESQNSGTFNVFAIDTSAGFEHLLPGGGLAGWTQRADAGAWNNTSTRIMHLELLLNAFSTPQSEVPS